MNYFSTVEKGSISSEKRNIVEKLTLNVKICCTHEAFLIYFKNNEKSSLSSITVFHVMDRNPQITPFAKQPKTNPL